MFEERAAAVLQALLGDYVHGLDADALRISVWRGDVVLRNLRLRPEALRGLGLPVSVQAGLLGELRMKVPWTALGKEPVVVGIDRVFCLVRGDSGGELLEDEAAGEAAARDARRARLAAAEKALLLRLDERLRSQDKAGGGKGGKEGGGGIAGSKYVQTILGNVQLKITNIHLRFEEPERGSPFACGLTLAELSAVSVDEDGEEAFVSSGALERLRKSARLSCLGLYFDPNACMLAPSEAWETLAVEEWEALFGRGIAREGSRGEFKQHFVLEPVSGGMRYERAGKAEMGDKDVPRETAKLSLEAITVALNRPQYICFQSLLGKFSLISKRMPHAHLRPTLTVRAAPRQWWRYALNALTFHGWVQRRFSWDTVKRVMDVRRAYVPLYSEYLEKPEAGDVSLRDRLEGLESGLTEACVVMFRMMAQTEIKRAASKKKKEKDATIRRELSSSSWYSNWWGSRRSSSKGEDDESDTADSGNALALTQQEWENLDSLFEEVEAPPGGESDPYQVLRTLDVDVGEVRLSLKDFGSESILSGTVRGLSSSLTQFPATTKFKMALQHYGILARESELLRSGEQALQTSSAGEKPSAAVSLSLINAPQDDLAEKVVYLTTAPCYVTVEPDVFFDVKEFFSPDKDRSQEDLTALGLQATAAATDMADATAAGIQDAFTSKKSIIFNCELHAPKIALPLKGARARGEPEIVLFVDLGFLTARSAGQMESSFIAKAAGQKESDSERFIFNLRDVSAAIIDGPSFNWEASAAEKDLRFLDKFAAVAVVQSALLGVAKEVPSLQVSLLAPSLHLNVGPGLVQSASRVVAPFLSLSATEGEAPGPSSDGVDVELEGDVLVLQWTGVARNVPELQRRHAQLKDMKFFLFQEAEGPSIAENVVTLSGKRLKRLPPDQAAGFDGCLGVVDARSGLVALTFTVADTEQLQVWERVTKAYMDQLTAISRVGHSVDSPSSSSPTTASSDARRIVVQSELQELRVRMSGRCFNMEPGGGASCNDEERDLIALFTRDVQLGFQSSREETRAFLGIRSVFCEDVVGGGYLLKPLSKGAEAGIGEADTPDRGLERTSAAVFFDAVEDPEKLTMLPELTAILPVLKTRMAELSPKDSQTLALSFITRQQVSPASNDPKSDLLLRLKPVEINCSRSTVGALMQIGDDLASAVPATTEQQSGESGSGAVAAKLADPSTLSRASSIEAGDYSAEAALPAASDPTLGSSEGVDFRFRMEIEEVDLQLLYEAPPSGGMERQTLSLMEIERFKLNFDSHSSGTFKLNVTLGNARVSDCMLPPDHQYRWPVDLKDTCSTSLIDVEVVCHKGRLTQHPKYDYSVFANLHAVRIIFLNRFLNEVLEYVSGLLHLKPSPKGAVEGVKGDVGRGSAASPVSEASKVKLKLRVEAPVIRMPKSSSDMDSVELDLGLLELENEFVAPRTSSGGACVIEETQISLSQIQAVATLMGQQHAGMVHQSQPIMLTLRRPTVGQWGARAGMECHVSIPILRAEVSEEEYSFMVTVAQQNLSEAAKTPGCAFRTGSVESSAPPTPSSAQVNDSIPRPASDSRDEALGRAEALPPLLLTVSLSHAELVLFSGNQRESPLTTAILSQLWLLMWQLPDGGSRGSLHIPELKLLDKRPGVPGGQQAVLSTGGIQKAVNSARGHQSLSAASEPEPSMLVLSWSQAADPSEMSVDIKLQEPTLFVSMEFVLDLCNFFGVDSLSNSLDDKFSNQSIFLGPEEFSADADTELGPAVQLFADSADAGMFTFNGNGNHLVLPKSPKHKQPLIVVGSGKTLRLKNVSIVNAGSLPRVVDIKAGGRILMQPEDGVQVLDGDDGVWSSSTNFFDEGSPEVAPPGQRALKATVSAIGMALLFKGKSNEVLSLQMGLDVTYSASAEKTKLSTDVRGMQVDLLGLLSDDKRGVSYNGSILGKCDMNFSQVVAEGSQEVALKTSDMNLTFSTSALNLILAVQKDLVEPIVRPPADQCTSFTTRFKELCVLDLQFPGSAKKELLTFWRPITSMGYGPLGDCMTIGTSPPSNVATLSKSYGLSRKPVSFRLLWQSKEFALWLPEAPAGYVCIGLVVTQGPKTPPSLSDTVLCIHKSLSIEAKMGEAFRIPSEGGEPRISWLNFRQLCNSASTFAAPRLLQTPCYDIRPPLRAKPEEVKERAGADNAEAIRGFVSIGGTQVEERFLTHSVRFSRVWWNRNSKEMAQLSFWRPQCAPGFRPVGDCLCLGFSPPPKAMVLQDVGDGYVVSPVRYDLVWKDGKSGVLGSRSSLTVWKPVPPPGYVALGFVARYVTKPPSTSMVFCVHQSLCEPIITPARPLHCFPALSRRLGGALYFWRKDESAATFTASMGEQRPSGEAMLSLKAVHRVESVCERDSAGELIVKALLGNVSCLLCDGHGQPIAEAQVTDINCVATQPRGGMGMTATFGSKVQNFNRALSVWEPVMSRCEWYVKVDKQPATDLKTSRATMNSFQIASVSGLNLTVSHTLLRSIAEFSEEISQAHDEVGAVKDTGAETVKNDLGIPLFLQLVERNGPVVVEVPKGASGVAIPAQSATLPLQDREASTTPQAHAPLRCHVSEVHGLSSETATRAACEVSLRLPDGATEFVRSRAVPVPYAGKMVVDEMLVLPVAMTPSGVAESVGELSVRVALVDVFSDLRGHDLAAAIIPLGKVVAAASGDHKYSARLQLACNSPPAPDQLGDSVGGVDAGVTVQLSLDVSGLYDCLATTPQAEAAAVGSLISLSAAGPWVPLHEEASRQSSSSVASVTPVMLGSEGLIMESWLESGKKRNRFRSLVQVVNTTKFVLELCARTGERNAQGVHTVCRAGPDDATDFVEVFENQTFNLATGWTPSSERQRAPFTDSHGKPVSSRGFPRLPLPHGWEWTDGWQIHEPRGASSEGWWFGASFREISFPPQSGSGSRGVSDTVRTRRYVRHCRRAALADEEIAISFAEEGSEIPCGRVRPGQTLSLPRTCCLADSNISLRVRPLVKETEYSFSHAATSSSESRGLVLGQMQDGTHLQVCAPGDGGEYNMGPFWVALECEGIELPLQNGQDSVTDWKINIQAPLLLENKLSAASDFIVWEHPKVLGASGGEPRQVVRGNVEAGGAAAVHAADPRRALSLTWVPSGCKAVQDRLRSQVTFDESEGSGGRAVPQDYVVTAHERRRLVLRLNHVFGTPLSSVSWPLTLQVWTPVTLVNNTSIEVRYVVVDNLDDPADVSAEGQDLLNLVSTKPGEQSSHERSVFGTAPLIAPHSTSMLNVDGSDSGDNDELGLQLFFKNSRCLRKALPLKVSAAPYVIQAALPSGMSCTLTVEVALGPVLGSLSVAISPHVVVANRTLNNFDVVTMGGGGQRFLEHDVPQSSGDVELQWPVTAGGSLKLVTVRHPDYGTSSPFSVRYPGFACLHIPFHPNESTRTSAPPMVLEVECAITTPGCLSISLNKVLRPRWLSPARIVNFTALDLRVRQLRRAGTPQEGDSWASVGSFAALPFTWTGFTEPLLELELAAPGLPPRSSIYVQEGPVPAVVSLDDAADSEDAFDHDSTNEGDLGKGATSSYVFELEGGERVRVVVEGTSQGLFTVSFLPAGRYGAGQDDFAEVLMPGLQLLVESQYEVIIDSLTLSLVDERPEELALLTLDGLKAQLSTLGYGDERAECFDLRLGDVQLDDMRTFSHFPVILGVNRRGGADTGHRPWLAMSVRRMLGDDPGRLHLPFAGADLSDTLLLQVHEPLIWRLMRLQEALARGNPAAGTEEAGGSSEKVAEVDPQVAINLLYLSGIKILLGFRADPQSRPSHMGLAQSTVFNLVNFDGAPLSLMRRWEVRRLVMQRSRFVQLCYGRLTRDVASQLVNVLRGVSISGAAAGALTSLSGAAAAISLDGDFKRQRSRDSSAKVEGFSDGVSEGALALGKGLASGVSGLFLKPMKGLKDGGAAGLAEGLAKGVVGVVAKPLSGGLDLVSKSVQGAAASIEGLGQIATGSSDLVRRRLPRAVRGDRVLREFSDSEALGQWMLKTAEWGGLLSGSAHDPLVKEKRRYAGDVYEFHMRTAEPHSAVVVSDRRILFVRFMDPRIGRGDRRPAAVKWEVRLSRILSLDLLGRGGGAAGATAGASSSSPAGRAEPPHQVLIVMGGDASGSGSVRGMVSSTLKMKRHQRGLAFPRGSQRAESFRARVLDVMKRQGMRHVAGVAQKALDASLRSVPSTRSLASENASESDLEGSVRSTPLLVPCVAYEGVWESHEGLDPARKGRVTIWRPVCPPGYFSAGDVLQIGSSPPPQRHSVVWGGEETALPVGFSLIWRDTGRALRGRPVSLWMPVPPDGFVALGAVAVAGQQKPAGGAVRCVREDLVYECQVFDSPLLYGAGRDREAWPVSAWPVDNALGTFLVSRGHGPPEATPYDTLG